MRCVLAPVGQCANSLPCLIDYWDLQAVAALMEGCVIEPERTALVAA